VGDRVQRLLLNRLVGRKGRRKAAIAASPTSEWHSVSTSANWKTAVVAVAVMLVCNRCIAATEAAAGRHSEDRCQTSVPAPDPILSGETMPLAGCGQEEAIYVSRRPGSAFSRSQVSDPTLGVVRTGREPHSAEPRDSSFLAATECRMPIPSMSGEYGADRHLRVPSVPVFWRQRLGHAAWAVAQTHS
jgi:hypothetical protein